MDSKAQALVKLDAAVHNLHKSIADFPVGAVSIYDYKPIEEKIQDIRESLVALSAKVLTLRAKVAAQRPRDLPGELSNDDLHKEFQDKVAQSVINRLAITSCLQSGEIQDILENSEKNEVTIQLRIIMEKLFILNDEVMTWEKTREQKFTEELDLKSELQNALSVFRDFLTNQGNIRKEKLKVTNPKIAEQKEAIDRRLQKINVMKRLITNMCAAAPKAVKDQVLRDLSKKHRELLTIEAIQEMARNYEYSKNG
ncbi:uncharacterized protein [Venturia canescens]|uniref:uncharacterized protein n=1 Tax=Venturia canescens TaxID=32260 RepID=UPI001C9C4B22|nr:uncharacterized protein LOC122415126 [Venturia canescens]